MDYTEAQKLIGSRVRINPQSEFEHQIQHTGNTVAEILYVDPLFKNGRTQWFRLQFQNGYQNSYRYEDLLLEDFLTNRKASALLKKEAVT